MRKITDEDLTLLFYGEHDDPGLATAVAESAELSARFDALCTELRLVDSFVPPHRGADYGAQVWQQIAPQLKAEPVSANKRLKTWRWKTWLSSISQPRFSMAGVFSVAMVAVLAFMLGRNGGQEIIPAAIDPSGSSVVANAVAGIDPGRLLTHSVSGHLEQVNLVLTQFANSSETSAAEAAYATDMLVANRLYRRAAISHGNHKLATFLDSLEPLLIELAYEAQSGSPATRKRMQEEVRNGLLFRVRVMNKQLNKPEISV